MSLLTDKVPAYKYPFVPVKPISGFDPSSDLQQTGCMLTRLVCECSNSSDQKMANAMEFVCNLRGFKLLLLVVTAFMALTTQPTVVKAVDIQGFNNAGACSGSGYTFPGIDQRICTLFNVGSVLIRDLSSCQTGRAYRGGGCATQVAAQNGPTVWCFTGGSYTGADWFNGCRRRRLQGAPDGGRCTSTAVPDGVHHTDDITLGSWMLKTPNATDVMAQLRELDDAEKVNWLKALGAYFVAGSDKVTTVV